MVDGGDEKSSRERVRNIALVLEYDGTDLLGFQYQVDGRTVQGELETALLKITGESIRVAGAGRTDAGVHAAGQVATFTTLSKLNTERLRAALNAQLPADVVVRSVADAPVGFHARFSAIGRTYVYRVWNDETPTALWRRFALHRRRPLDVDTMNEAARPILGTHDFSSFAGSIGSAAVTRSRVREVESADWTRQGPFVELQISANAFLPHMVRNLVGTFLLVGEGKIAAESVAAILEARDRRLAGPTAPARGLCLARVEYAPSAFSVQPAARKASAEGRGERAEPETVRRLVLADDEW